MCVCGMCMYCVRGIGSVVSYMACVLSVLCVGGYARVYTCVALPVHVYMHVVYM